MQNIWIKKAQLTNLNINDRENHLQHLREDTKGKQRITKVKIQMDNTFMERHSILLVIMEILMKFFLSLKLENIKTIDNFLGLWENRHSLIKLVKQIATIFLEDNQCLLWHSNSTSRNCSKEITEQAFSKIYMYICVCVWGGRIKSYKMIYNLPVINPRQKRHQVLKVKLSISEMF